MFPSSMTSTSLASIATAASHPPWARLRDVVAKEIRSGQHAVGKALPAEAELMRRFEVSRNTLRQAMADLAREGLIRIEQGRGTFVQERLEYAITARTRLTENLAAQGLDAAREVLAVEMFKATSSVGAALQLESGESVWQALSRQGTPDAVLNMATQQVGAWTILGLNAMLFGTGWDEENAQWDWLASTLAAASSRPVALFMHKPPFLYQWDDDGDDAMAIPRAARHRLGRFLDGSGVRLVATGHRHEYRSYAAAGRPAVVWAPPVGFVIANRTPPVPEATTTPGCVLHTLVGSGVISQPLQPAGLISFDSSFLHAMREREAAELVS